MSSAPANERPAIDLEREGPSDAAWAEVGAALPTWHVDAARQRRLVVVAPHPDDESLGVGGLVATLARRMAVTIVSVTDGEGAPGAVAPNDLARRRRAELADAVHTVAPDAEIVRLGLRDGGVQQAGTQLTELLASLVHGDDLVVSTLDGDGHPDHDAVGRSARCAAAGAGAEHLWFPVWAWHWHDPDDSILRRAWRVELDRAAQCAKASAVACHRSQLDGPEPVVPASHVRRCLRPFEVLVPS